jgi:ATP-dependent DNA helicase RecQ
MLQLLQMKGFCMSNRCRRAFILQYFGETQPVQCTGCDVCNSSAASAADGSEMHDFTSDIKTVLELVCAVTRSLTINQIISVLRGQKDGQKYHSGAIFGIGSSRSSKWWDQVCNIMVSSQLLQMQAKSVVAGGRTVSFAVICATAAGSAFIKSCKSSTDPQPSALLPLPPSLRSTNTHAVMAFPKGQAATDQFSENISPLDAQLFAALKAKRLELANTENVPAYVIAYDSLLRGITHHKPATTHQAILSFLLLLLSLSGM